MTTTVLRMAIIKAMICNYSGDIHNGNKHNDSNSGDGDHDGGDEDDSTGGHYKLSNGDCSTKSWIVHPAKKTPKGAIPKIANANRTESSGFAP